MPRIRVTKEIPPHGRGPGGFKRKHFNLYQLKPGLDTVVRGVWNSARIGGTLTHLKHLHPGWRYVTRRCKTGLGVFCQKETRR